MQANVRSSRYYIAQTSAYCEACARCTAVIALALPPHHEVLDEDQWQRVAASAVLFHLSNLPQWISDRMSRMAAGFRLTVGGCWENHCEHCGGRLSDDELHCEVGAFTPQDAEEASGVELSLVLDALAATAAGYSLAPEFFRHMRRR